MRKFSKGEEEAEVNMTPMLDIVFIMLIFFIVTASFVKESGIEINKPPEQDNQSDAKPDPEKRPIGFVIDGANRIKHDMKRISIGSVSAIIKKNSVERPQAPVVIMAEKGGESGIAMHIYDVARDIGIPSSQIVMMIKKKK